MFDHPIHSIFVHFPAGLIPTSVIFFVLFLFFRKQVFELLSILLLNISLFFILLTITTGIYDWQTRYAGDFIPPIMIKFFLSIILFLIGTLIYILRKQRVKMHGNLSLSKYYSYILLNFLLLPTVIVIGYFGGDLIHHSSIKYNDSKLNYGFQLFNKKCNSCHPYGQELKSPFFFPSDSSGNYGSASLINSKLLNDGKIFISYVRNPKRMPPINLNYLPDDDLKYVIDFIYYLKNGYPKSEKFRQQNSNITDNELKIGKKIFSDICVDCHPDGGNIIEGKEKFRIIGSSKVSGSLDKFKIFLFNPESRNKNSEMPVFSKNDFPDTNIISLQKYLLTLYLNPIP